MHYCYLKNSVKIKRKKEKKTQKANVLETAGKSVSEKASKCTVLGASFRYSTRNDGF